MKNMNNKSITVVVIALIATLMTIGIISLTNTHMVSAQLSVEDQNYNTGFDDARIDCYQTHTCWSYYNSAAFENHTPGYKDGYTSIVDWYYHKDIQYCDHVKYDCSGTNDYDHDAATQAVSYNNRDDSTNNQAYSDNGNKNIDTTNTATDTTQKTDTTQNVVNTPTIICKGICSIPNIQSVTSNTGTTTGNSGSNNNDDDDCNSSIQNCGYGPHGDSVPMNEAIDYQNHHNKESLSSEEADENGGHNY